MNLCKMIAVGVLVSVMFSGCEKRSEAPMSYGQLPSDAVILRVNGTPLTKGAFEREFALILEMAKLTEKKFDGKIAEKIRYDYEERSANQFARRVFLEEYARTNNVADVTDEEREKMRRALARSMKRGSYERIRAGLPDGLGPELDQYVERKLRAQKISDALVRDRLMPVTDEEVRKRRRRFEDYNAMAQATNAFVWTQASNFWHRIQADATAFDDYLLDYEGAGHDRINAVADSGEIGASFFDDDPSTREYLLQMKINQISPPLSGDNGIVIMKLLEILPKDPSVGRKEEHYRIARIFFELPFVWEQETDEQLRASIGRVRGQQILRTAIEEMFKSATIEFPCGNTLFDHSRKTRSRKKGTN